MKIEPLVIANTDFVKLGLIENGSIIWTEKYYQIGDFEIHAPATSTNVSLLQKDYYVFRKDSDYVGIIEKIEITASVEEGNYITVSGHFAENLLNRRIVNRQTQLNTTLEKGCRSLIYDNFTNPTDVNRQTDIFAYTDLNTDLESLRVEKQLTGDKVGDSIASMCKSFAIGFKTPLELGKITYYRNIRIGDNLNGKTIYFDFPDNMATNMVDGRTAIYVNNNNKISEVKRQLSWNNNYAELDVVEGGIDRMVYSYTRTPRTLVKMDKEELPANFGTVTNINTSAASYKYIKIIDRIVNNTSAFIFKIYKGTDRSYQQTENPWIVFSERYDNLSKSYYTWDSKDTANFTYVAGEGEGTARKIVEINFENKTGLNRKEQWVDARDLQSDSESVSAEKYNQQLIQRGKEKTKQTNESFNGDVVFNNHEYKKDFFLGDIVTVVTRFGVELNLRLIEVTESQDENGYQLVPTFIDLKTEAEDNND